MTVELLQNLSLAFFVIAGILFLISIALFFLLDVPKLVGDISGATARKAIENIRQQNEQSGDKAYKPSPVNLARGRTTDKISPSGRLEKRAKGLGGAPGTEKLRAMKQEAASEQVMPQVRSGNNETTVLNFEQPVSNETTVLSQDMYRSTTEPVTMPQPVFVLEVEMGFLGSAEIIE